MAALFFVLLIVAAWDVTKTAVKAQHADYQASRPAKKSGKPGKSGKGSGARHTAGYWTGEAAHGFPVFRNGWWAGWLAHKTARNQQRSIREQARTTHLQGLAEHLRVIREQRELQRQANEEIQTAIKTADQPPKGREEVREAVAKVLPFPPGGPATSPPLPSDGVGKPQPGPYVPRGADAELWGLPQPDPRLNDTQRERDADPRLRNACAACGNLGSAEDPLAVHPDGFRVHESHITDPDSGLYVPDDDEPFPEPEDGNWPTGVPHRRNGDGDAWERQAELARQHLERWTAEHGDGSPYADHLRGDVARYEKWRDEARAVVPPDDVPHRPDGGAASPVTNGGNMSADTTYDSVLSGSKAASAQADEDTATIQKRMDEAYARADELTAANVDPSVIDQQMSYADSLKRAVDALSDGGEHAGSTADQLQRYHGQMDEAVKSAPGKVADREFHEG
jgi:hypothetical protein